MFLLKALKSPNAHFLYCHNSKKYAKTYILYSFELISNLSHFLVSYFALQIMNFKTVIHYSKAKNGMERNMVKKLFFEFFRQTAFFELFVLLMRCQRVKKASVSTDVSLSLPGQKVEKIDLKKSFVFILSTADHNKNNDELFKTRIESTTKDNLQT
jgi:hypothetical protein